MKLKMKKLEQDAKLFSYAHEGDAGLDIYSYEDKTIKAGTRETIKTGIAIALEKGYVALVWDKSGLASKKGIKTMAGVIDSGYRGEISIVLFNTSKEDYEIKKGDKIAQILIQPIISAEIEEVNSLDETSRGENGFGSTGKQ
ncbi:dUTP diphosphatase [Candidatus Woesearchaeota archaeon]|jgi:dUTP pyrophosphatase|nr:dUTP diphosphatase [Candidatus Woesearchaeota archaeon]